MKRLINGLLGIAGALTPAMARAEDADSVWTIYAPAAGSAIFEVLVGVSMMLERDGGGIVGIMLTLALLGIIATAARIGTAGMALSQFLTYLLSVWVVSVTTFNIKVPVVVADRTSNYYNVVERVPILFAAPAALVSQAGATITEKIETFLSLPDQLKMTGARQFNLLGKVMADGDTLRITDPALRMSVSNYVGDCAIPGMARGVISMTALKTSTDIWASLEFPNEGVMTRYKPMDDNPDGACAAARQPRRIGADGVALLNCREAHACISNDIDRFADAFNNAGLDDLAASGAATPLGEAMTSAHMWMTGANGASMSGAGFLRQRIMANSMTGAFRSAAAQAGNTELITTAAITQAEEAQKSTWVSGAAIFNDLMGYIYIVSQVVIYGMAPIVAMLLFAPGFGFRGALSYLQVMIWIALWEPLLALVNFTVALFAKSSIGDMLVTQHGYTLASTPMISEQANNLMMAAGFMGSMVPVLAWNIAKGSISLMDFVSAGGGGQGASQAGSTSSSGNLSLDNMSMGGRNMNKVDMAASTNVGNAGVVASNTPLGAITNKVNAGGAETKVNEQALKMDASMTSQANQAYSKAVSVAMAQKASDAWSAMDSAGKAASAARTAGTQVSSENSTRASTSTQSQDALSNSVGHGVAKGYELSYSSVSQTAESLAKALNMGAGLNASAPFSPKTIADKAASLPAGAQKNALLGGLEAMKQLATSGGGLLSAFATSGRAAAGVLGTAGSITALAMGAPLLGAAAAPAAAAAAGVAALSAIRQLGSAANAGTSLSNSTTDTFTRAERQAASSSDTLSQNSQKMDTLMKSAGISVDSSVSSGGSTGFTMSVGGRQEQIGSIVQSAGLDLMRQTSAQFQQMRSDAVQQAISASTPIPLNQADRIFSGLNSGGGAFAPLPAMGASPEMVSNAQRAEQYHAGGAGAVSSNAGAAMSGANSALGSAYNHIDTTNTRVQSDGTDTTLRNTAPGSVQGPGAPEANGKGAPASVDQHLADARRK